jgi:MFS family permease
MRALLVVLAGQAMASMDASILVVAAPSLRADLGASGAQLQLIVVMYTLVFAALVVGGARLGDVLGPRRAFLMGLGGFTVASLAGGLAPTAGTLIAARAGQGAAGALMTPQVLTIIQRTTTGEARTRAISAYSLILAVGVAAGQVVGGALVAAGLTDGAWRPALLINAPVGAVLLVVGRRGLPSAAPATEGGAAATARRTFDGLGAGLLAVGALAVVVPLTLGREAGWPWWTAACPVVAAGAGVAFAWSARRTADPVLDLALLRAPGVAWAAVAVATIMGSYAGLLLCLTLHLQDGLGYTPLQAGLTFAIYASGFALASLTWTRAPAALRRRLPALGALGMAAAIAAIGVLARGGAWPALAAAPLLLAAGAGHAVGYAPLGHRLTAAVSPAQVSDVSGLILTAGLIGSVVGTAAFSAIALATGSLPWACAAIVATLGLTALAAARAASSTP